MLTTNGVRLVIAHPRQGFRDGLRALLESDGEFAVAASVESIAEATALPAAVEFDILLVYEPLRHEDLPAVGTIAAKTAVILVIEDPRDPMAMPAVRGGVRGVVLNQLAVDGLVEAIRTVAMGYVWIPPALQAEVVANLRHTPAPNPLTLRERDVTRLVATGLRNGEIAGKLSISEQTVKKHLNNIFQKLELRDRVELARYALRTALVAQGDGWGAAQSHGSTYLLAAHETLLPRERPDGALARSMRARRGMSRRARRRTTEEDAGIAAEPAALEAAPPFDKGEDGGS